jgi:hypothetical protein
MSRTSWQSDEDMELVRWAFRGNESFSSTFNNRIQQSILDLSSFAGMLETIHTVSAIEELRRRIEKAGIGIEFPDNIEKTIDKHDSHKKELCKLVDDQTVDAM